MDPDARVLAALAVATLALRAVYALRYRDAARVLALVGRQRDGDGRGDGYRDGARDGAGDRPRYYRAADGAFAPLPFLWCWLDLALLLRAGAALDRWPVWLAVAAVVAGRMRALQEIGHNAVHCAMCRSRDWQWLLSNVFFQFPLMKRDMHSRFITHVKEHHRTPNKPDKDPNLKRIIDGGMRPGISPREFSLRLLYPLTPRGFWVNLRTSLVNSTRGNHAWHTAVARVLAVAALWSALVWAGGPTGFLVGFLAPLLTLYPLYSWISILVEHRWFCSDEGTTGRWQMECVNCRPTAFPGLAGWLIGALIFPLSDKYHLAHSLYPYVRWDYLPAIDAHLRARDRYYPVFRSEGLLVPRGALPAALSELKLRLTAQPAADLAPWAARFAVPRAARAARPRPTPPADRSHS